MHTILIFWILAGALSSGNILEQNNPNPFSETIEIIYYLPNKYKGNLRLIITDESGLNILNESVVCFGKPCQIIVSSSNYNTGVYLYGIKINGKIVKSKKMMIVK
ncbi:MAG: hypothetical protein NT007_06995 [Candidatus Kapabacteria bacterium]|nr:hypothetical protein [Candidatus Kapabacteria bacterium]